MGSFRGALGLSGIQHSGLVQGGGFAAGMDSTDGRIHTWRVCLDSTSLPSTRGKKNKKTRGLGSNFPKLFVSQSSLGGLISSDFII